MSTTRVRRSSSVVKAGAIVGSLALVSLAVSGCGGSQASTASTTSPSATAAAGAGVARSAAESQTGIAYAPTSPSQTLDLYLPASDGSAPVPVVLLIHGGAFAGGDSGMETGYAQELANQGIAAASVNYRLSGEAPYPAGAQDVKAAVRWLRANAAQYGLDPNHIGAWGQSAGGWMTNMLGATGDQQTIFDDPALGNADQSSAVQAVVSWFGPSDFGTMDEQAQAVTACDSQAQVHGTADSPESRWLGEAVSTSDKTASTNLSSYFTEASALPAWYLAHGDSDCLVPGGQSAELADALKASGADPTYVVLQGAGHMDPAFDSTQLAPTIDFLKANLAAS